MAWLGKVSLGNFPDLAGAVNKFSESVKNIEKNFDNALGLEEKGDSSEASGLWPSATDRKALFEPMMAFMGHKSEENSVESSEEVESLEYPSPIEQNKEVFTDEVPSSITEQTSSPEQENEESESKGETKNTDPDETEAESQLLESKKSDPTVINVETHNSFSHLQQEESTKLASSEISEPEESKSQDQVEIISPVSDESHSDINILEQKLEAEDIIEKSSPVQLEELDAREAGDEIDSNPTSTSILKEESTSELVSNNSSDPSSPEMVAEVVGHESGSLLNTSERNKVNDFDVDTKDQRLSSGTNVSDTIDSDINLEKVKMEMKMMEAALQGAARQAQAKADEIEKLMIENEQLKTIIEDLKRKSNEAESESLRDEYHQRVASLERKVYALTKERDTLRREQNKKSDAASLLKEKDEIINQVMAEGESLSKKQAAQESQIRKLRAQIREFEEEKKGLVTKLQVEENKVESIKRDKVATEKFLQETIEKHQIEITTQKEHYTNALNAAKEAEALAEARANDEARTELESLLKEAGERESTLVKTLEELRHTLSRKEQQAASKEDMLHRDIDDLQTRYKASERRCEELITQVPESTRPLLRQIEAMQETTARRAEAWVGVERSLNSRLQEAEAKAAVAEENERSMNERVSQTLSRMAVLEAQVSCLRAELTQLSRSLEKERQRASENRQEYLAAQEAVASHEIRVNQLEVEIRELKKRHKQELQDIMAQKELLQQDLKLERTARLELERNTRHDASILAEQGAATKQMNTYSDNGAIPQRKLSSAGSLSSIEESFFLQASLDSSDSFSERRHSEVTMTPYFLKSMTPSTFEATLRQKDGELASYMSRLASLESIRDSLAEELVKMTEQCEKLRSEAAILPGVRSELEALRRRHSAALELMGERDEELEELRADIVDLKEMYREQVNMLVNQIETSTSSFSTA